MAKVIQHLQHAVQHFHGQFQQKKIEVNMVKLQEYVLVSISLIVQCSSFHVTNRITSGKYLAMVSTEEVVSSGGKFNPRDEVCSFPFYENFVTVVIRGGV